MQIPFGALVRADGPGNNGPKLLSEDRELAPHLKQPWLHAWMQRQLGLPLLGQEVVPHASDAVTIDREMLSCHGMLTGASGSGKTRALLLILMALVGHCSIVLLDPKGETFSLLLSLLAQRGVDPGSVIVLDPRSGEGIPGWNPFLSGLPVSQAAADFVAVLQQSGQGGFGPRMLNLLINALIILGEHRLSLFELPRLLLRPEYLQGLLRQPINPGEPLAFNEARAFFTDEFLRWSPSERGTAVGPVLNKVYEILRSSFLAPLLCARRNTLDLGSLWKTPKIVLVRLDRPALGEEGTRVLSGLLAGAAFRTALRTQGPVPVLLAIDELASVEKYVSVIAEIVAVARSQKLFLLVACQFLSQVGDTLRESLLANTAVQVFFRLGSFSDARLVASSLSAGAAETISQVQLTVAERDRKTGAISRTRMTHLIEDARGQALRLTPDLYRVIQSEWLFAPDPLSSLIRTAQSYGFGRLYVKAPDSGHRVSLMSYVKGLPTSSYWLDGPRPLSLVVSFPRPRILSTVRQSQVAQMGEWLRQLQELPVREACVRIWGRPAGVVRVAPLEIPSAGSRKEHDFIQACGAVHGQTSQEVEAMLTMRQEQVEQVASGRAERRREVRSEVRSENNAEWRVESIQGEFVETEVDDGSIK